MWEKRRHYNIILKVRFPNCHECPEAEVGEPDYITMCNKCLPTVPQPGQIVTEKPLTFLNLKSTICLPPLLSQSSRAYDKCITGQNNQDRCTGALGVLVTRYRSRSCFKAYSEMTNHDGQNQDRCWQLLHRCCWLVLPGKYRRRFYQRSFVAEATGSRLSQWTKRRKDLI